MSDGNDKAFPFFFPDEPGRGDLGLTKREYFAAMALQGLCSNESCLSEGRVYTARIALAMADSLLAELSK